MLYVVVCVLCLLRIPVLDLCFFIICIFSFLSFFAFSLQCSITHSMGPRCQPELGELQRSTWEAEGAAVGSQSGAVKKRQEVKSTVPKRLLGEEVAEDHLLQDP